MQADFTAMIVHDLRSPLTNIIGTVEAMVEGLFGPVNEEQKEWLLKLLANGRSVADFINDYLDLSKVEAGRIDITKEEVDLGQLIQNSIENCLPSARNKNILIAGAVDPVLFRIKADPRRLNQVLSNLLSNAVKFTADGGQIEVGARQMNGTEIKVWVKDSGVGIASEEISSLFEKYRQLTSGKKSAHKGTGLGLVICKKIVEAHGGQIWVESKEGKGTTFFITLPF
jgi:signal transduction histidine kinase